MGERSDDVEEDIAEFISRSHIDEAAATALKQLPLEQQREVIAGSITHAANPSAVLLSRIKRVKLGMRNRKRPHSQTEGSVMPPPPPAPPPGPGDHDPHSAIELFLEQHGIHAEAFRSLFGLSPEQQRLVIQQPLPQSERTTRVAGNGTAADPPLLARLQAPPGITVCPVQVRRAVAASSSSWNTNLLVGGGLLETVCQ